MKIVIVLLSLVLLSNMIYGANKPVYVTPQFQNGGYITGGLGITGDLTGTGSANFTKSVTCDYIYGDGSHLTNVSGSGGSGYWSDNTTDTYLYTTSSREVVIGTTLASGYKTTPLQVYKQGFPLVQVGQNDGSNIYLSVGNTASNYGSSCIGFNMYGGSFISNTKFGAGSSSSNNYASWIEYSSTLNMLTFRATGAMGNDGDTATGTDIFYMDFNGNAFHPYPDNTKSLGTASYRWTAVYAVNGTIQTSDGKLKKNITNISSALNKVKQLRAVDFNWKDANAKTKARHKGNKHLGFIAQEMVQVIPDCVYGGGTTEVTITPAKYDKDNNLISPAVKEVREVPLGINYGEIVPVLVKAIQEQQAIIDAQAQTISDIQLRLDNAGL